MRFLKKAIEANGRPEKINIDKSGANKAAIDTYNNDTQSIIEPRQCKYLNNIVEQDHRAIKRIIKPMMGFKAFYSAHITLSGIEMVHMLRKGQLRPKNRKIISQVEQFYSLAV